LTNLYKLFKEGTEPPKEFGHNRDWNIDLIPKFIMSGGKLVKILLKTRVSRYLEWRRNRAIMQRSTPPMCFRTRRQDCFPREATRSRRCP
jgi:RAB protein geranylgeranyltransferase component A